MILSLLTLLSIPQSKTGAPILVSYSHGLPLQMSLQEQAHIELIVHVFFKKMSIAVVNFLSF